MLERSTFMGHFVFSLQKIVIQTLLSPKAGLHNWLNWEQAIRSLAVDWMERTAVLRVQTRTESTYISGSLASRSDCYSLVPNELSAPSPRNLLSEQRVLQVCPRESSVPYRMRESSFQHEDTPFHGKFVNSIVE